MAVVDVEPANADALASHLAELARRLANEASTRGVAPEIAAQASRIAAEYDEARTAPRDCEHHDRLPGLARALAVFRLSLFEGAAVVIALSVEIDERFCELFAAVHRDPRVRRPTVGMVARWLAHWFAGDAIAAAAALGPDGHLFRMGVLELVGDGPRAARELAITEAFWPRLLDLGQVGALPVIPAAPGALERLVLAPRTRAETHAALVWARKRVPHDVLFVVEGADGSGRTALATAIAAELGFGALTVSATQADNPGAVRTLAREATWHAAAVIVHGAMSIDALERLSRELPMPLFVIAEGGARSELARVASRAVLSIEIATLEAREREALWVQLLRAYPKAVELDAAMLASQFRFGPGRAHEVVATAAQLGDSRDEPMRYEDIVRACGTRETGIGGLAQRLECPYDEADIVLPVSTRRELAMALAWARHGATVFHPDGPGGQIKERGGLVCLFAGPPGTGKTMAAQILARTLQRPLLRIDLSQVVNKYIGETEKNLERVFSEAQATGAVLFFDEADALFGKRTDVRSANDRYANLETAFLLQRLETHYGLVVLATNLQSNLDAAFLRRIQVVADFPIPGPEERKTIWERHMARDHLAADVDPSALATMFALAGGDIRNAVISAVLLAASERTSVAMRHLAIGVWRELHKTGRLIMFDDFGAWRDDVIAYVRDGARV